MPSPQVSQGRLLSSQSGCLLHIGGGAWSGMLGPVLILRLGFLPQTGAGTVGASLAPGDQPEPNTWS